MFINHRKLPIQIRGLIGSSAAQAASIAGFVCTACGRPIQARSDRQHKVQPQPRCEGGGSGGAPLSKEV